MNITKTLNANGTYLIKIESPIRTFAVDNVEDKGDLEKKVAVFTWYVRELDKLDLAKEL